MSLLVLNTGSSSLKFSLFDADARDELASGEVDWSGSSSGAEIIVRQGGEEKQRNPADATDHGAAAALAIRTLAQSSQPIAAVGHRVVHGGTLYREAVRINADLKQGIARLAELAPLHNPPALAAIDVAEQSLPDVPQFAVFDTAFYATLPSAKVVYPLPYAWFADLGVRRFGFHGISHAYCAQRTAEVLGRDLSELRLVICHLGNGCSATAVRNGAAIDTTMGFTPNDGLMMGTRSGSIDPGIPLYLIHRRGFSPEQLDDIMNHGSGLLGVSGISSDFRRVSEAAEQGKARAQLALDIYAARVRSTIGALVATLGGVDALVFTAGVGEHSAKLRAAACEGLGCMGIHLDLDRNSTAQADTEIAAGHSSARIVVLRTREDLMIAREMRRLLTGG